MSAAQQHREHIEFARRCERRRQTPLVIRLSRAELARRGDLIDLTVDDKGGKAMLMSPLVRKMFDTGIVRIDLDPIVVALRRRHGIQLGQDAAKTTNTSSTLVEFPCMYALQDWLEDQPVLKITVDDCPAAELDMMSMRSYIL